MPIHPIGVKNRKGSLGSPYAVRDYLAVNPEFGTLEDLKHFVATAHGLGMHVILDWVANHTAWDNPLVTQHPDWYARNWQRRISPDVVERLGGHHRAGLRPAGGAPLHDRSAEVLGARSRHRRLPLRRRRIRPARFLEQCTPRTRRDPARVPARRMGGDRPARRTRSTPRMRGAGIPRPRSHDRRQRGGATARVTTRRRTTPIRARQCA